VGNPFELLQREWMVDYHSVALNESREGTKKQFLWHLARIADLQRTYPYKRLLAKYLSNSRYLPKNKEDMRQIASVLLSLSDCFHSVVPFCISYIEKFVEKNKDVEVDKYIYSKAKNETNLYNAVWYLYYLSKYMKYYHKDFMQEMKGKFNNPFLLSIYNQTDQVFLDKKISGAFYKPNLPGKIYDQTKKYAEIY
jgi:hypothetical protein